MVNKGETNGFYDETTPLRITFSDKSVNNSEVDVEVKTEDEAHPTWTDKGHFYMSIMSYTTGLGCIWRFPYLCQQNGGGKTFLK